MSPIGQHFSGVPGASLLTISDQGSTVLTKSTLLRSTLYMSANDGVLTDESFSGSIPDHGIPYGIQ